MTESTPTGPVLVGVVEGQRPEVLRTAARVARELRAPLLVLYVAPDPYLVGDYVDPMTGSIPVGVVTGSGPARPSAPPSLVHEVESVLDGAEHEFRVSEGEPALALSDVAEQTDARMIVVGTRDAGVLASIAEFLSGSVAVHLAHRQHRPVMVVPRAERDPSRPAPWELAE
ncbi:universal stress protein [Rathayibacter sp. ZW T2_19]|uniref:Universal stress protein n=1 Tax=Rathayibacter rubneri TaxID=2950106 RepID=A0A9X2DZS1_9MICO|nr:universal stress protein [Rathayibacter rubneri]MCM6762753.1 universal stress protein [Rathayibacter rubneri]